MRRFDHEYNQLKDLIDSGDLGRPLVVHCAHRNPAVPNGFDSAMIVKDSLVHEVDVTRFLLDEEITSVQIIRPAANSLAPEGIQDPQIAIFETESGRHVDAEVFVTTGVAYEVRTEVVGELGSAMIGLDVGLIQKDQARQLGWADHPRIPRTLRAGIRHRVRPVDQGCEDGRRHRQLHRRTRCLGRVRRGRCLRRRCEVSGDGSARRRGHGCARLCGRSLAMKVALDPTPFHRDYSLLELPQVVADLGYEYLQLTTARRHDPVLQSPESRRRARRRVPEGLRECGSRHRVGAPGPSVVRPGRGRSRSSSALLEAGHPDHGRSRCQRHEHRILRPPPKRPKSPSVRSIVRWRNWFRSSNARESTS